MKMLTIAQFIAQQVEQGCQCQYSGNYIINGQLFCTSKNSAMYLAQLTPTDNKTALEIWNILQQWVLSGPAIIINSLSYKVDPSCSIEVKELGVTSCNSASESDEGSTINVTVVVSVIFAVVVLLMILSGLITASLYYRHKRNLKSKDL